MPVRSAPRTLRNTLAVFVLAGAALGAAGALVVGFHGEEATAGASMAVAITASAMAAGNTDARAWAGRAPSSATAAALSGAP